jgi:putative transposase
MELYHLLNRGVEKRAVVLDDSDRLRFIHDLFMFNDSANVDDNHRSKDFHKSTVKRKLLVRIHAFCLMGNHYHLLVSEEAENGIPRFMRKLNMGYAKYFNQKYKRSGVLWQGPYKKVSVQKDSHFLYIPFYIHLNPLDFEFPEWRDGGVQNIRSAIRFLETYRWSSFLDYQGKKNFPSLIHTPFLSKILGSSKSQAEVIQEIITSPEVESTYKYLE